MNDASGNLPAAGADELLTAGHPVEVPRHRVGRWSIVLQDTPDGTVPGGHGAGPTSGRELAVECWYPATPAADGVAHTRYEVLPGVSFRAAHARHRAPAMAGRWPLVVFSHGRTGTRVAYSMFCEALAARGAIVVSADHPGDSLVDWLGGRQVDDHTNERNRVGDAHRLLDAFRHGHPAIPLEIVNAVDRDRVVLAGHSYGAYTALATAAGARGVPPHPGVRAVVGLQAYTRTMSDSLLGRVHTPTLLVVSGADRTTPPHVDAERPWALIPGRPCWRLDVPFAGHQAVSDIALYAELARHLPDLPELVRVYLATSVDAPGDRPWRQVVATQVAVVWDFLLAAVDPDARAAAGDVFESDDPRVRPAVLQCRA